MSRDGRLLVIGDYPVDYANGIGETLTNLLADHPAGALFQSHPEHLRSSRAPERSFPFVAPRRPQWWPGWAARFYQPILKLRQSAAEDRLFAIASAAIAHHRIEAVLCYPVTPWVLFAVVRLRRAFPNVRFVFYVMDDWEGHHTCFGLPFTAKRRAALAEIVATSDARFACSHLMQRDYEQRFGNAWGVLHKGVDATVAVPPVSPARVDNILYTGGMNMFRWDAVLAFVEGMRRYRDRSGRNMSLTLLGTDLDRDYAAALAPYPFVKAEPWIDNAACLRRLASADMLYLPLSFEHKLDRIANLAMPTKFSEYLASGRPTIFHVTRQSEVHALATQAGLPLTLNTVDPSAIAGFLEALDRDGIDADAYRAKASALLAGEFNQTVLRQRLREACFPCP